MTSPCSINSAKKYDLGSIPARGSNVGSRSHLPESHLSSGLIFGEEYRSPADRQDAHIHHNHRRDQNAFEGLLSKYRHYTHPRIYVTLVDLLAVQKKIHPGVFAIMEGTTAKGSGSRLMQPVVKNVILASADQVAIDAVAAHVIGFDPLEFTYLLLAHKRGLGIGKMREIELVGDDLSGQNWGFKTCYNSHSFF